MKNVLKVIGLGVVVGIFAGCASTPDSHAIAKQEKELQELRYELEQAQKKREEKRLSKTLDDVPSWVVEPPRYDSTGIYGVGVASSDSIPLVMKKAKLQAEYEIAQQLRQEISGLERSYAEDGFSRGSSEQFQQAVERFVSAVPMRGQEIVKREISVVDGKYTAYVLMKLSFEQMQKILDQQQASPEVERMKDAFMELRERVNAEKERTAEASATSESRS